MEREYISNHHKIADRSIPERKLTSGKISTSKACMWIKGSQAAIFNYSIPYVRYYVNGVETDTPTIAKGDSFVDADCYLEGIESTYAMLLQCLGYYGSYGVRVDVRGNCGSCDNDGVAMCQILTTHEAIVENVSGDVDYSWEITGGSIKSGQDTNKIVVETIGIYSVMVAVRCTVTDNHSSAYDEEDCLHGRTHNQIGDSVLVPYVTLKPKPDLVPYTGEIK